MKNILFIIYLFLTINNFAQEKSVITDSCFVSGHKFILTEKNGIAKIKAYIKKQEIPIIKTVKMSPPVYFVKQNGKDKILQDDIFTKNGDIVKVFLIVGNEAPKCMKANQGLKYKESFCGMNVQGIVISPNGIRLTEFMYNDFTCVKENYLDMKDLYTFAHSK